jgi:hypothetical protein
MRTHRLAEQAQKLASAAEEAASRVGEGSLIRPKCAMRASSNDSSEPLLLALSSAGESCCPMTSRRQVIPYAHKTGI